MTDPVYFKQVYQEAVELCAYLCNLYGLTEKNIICHCEGHAQGIASNHGDVMHWFPKHGKSMDTFRADVKVLLNKGASPVPAPATPSVPATDNESTIWNFLKSKGLNDFAVAGIMGNLYAESALKPTNLQNSYEKKLGYTDDSYTAAVDNRSYNNFVRDSAGYGLVQWTYWSRKQGLLDYAKSVQKSIGDLTMQLEYLWKELQGYTAVMTTLKAAKSVLEASNAILTGYEKPADQGAAVQQKRAGYGQTYYGKYAGKTQEPASGVTYRVQVGAFSRKSNADKQLAAVQAKGFEGFITNLNGLYKVQVGAYSIKANADQ